MPLNERTNIWGDTQPTEYIGPTESKPGHILGALASLLGLGEWQRGERAGVSDYAPGPGVNALPDILSWLDAPAKAAAPLAAGMVKWGKYTHPQDFLARAMDISELLAIRKAADSGLPYHASGTVVNPVQQGVTNPWGMLYDIVDQMAVQHASPIDAAAEYIRSLSGSKVFMGDKSASPWLDNRLKDLYKSQGKQGATYNELVADLAHPAIRPAGVMIPRDPVDDFGRVQTNQWIEHAKEQGLPVFYMPHRLDVPEGKMWEFLQQDPMQGTWTRGEDQGLSILWSDLLGR